MSTTHADTLLKHKLRVRSLSSGAYEMDISRGFLHLVA